MWSLAVVSFVLGYICILLIGSHEYFQGTVVERWHYALTDGVCDFLEQAINRVCGRRGNAFLEATEAACCQGSNPIGQVFFGILFIGCYLGVHTEIFPMLENTPGFSTWHRYTGGLTAVIVLYFFFLVCYCDPGKINESNLDAHLALYPPDGILFPEPPQHCSTCIQLKPGRSKHCNATKSCVARFDHWCIWINNAVGLYNTRWFLCFLFSTAAACLYGAVLGGNLIAADMREKGAWSKEWIEPRTRNKVYLGDHWGLVFQFVLSRYSMGAAMSVFLGVAFWIVLGFTGLQIYRIKIGMTTNESWKIKEMRSAGAVVATRSGNGLSPSYSHYNRGWRRNFAEIMFPKYYLLQSLRDKDKDG
ncbi:hypothetical protein Ndes2526B_g08479 [Nannochloris sp. 'desiccata']